MKKKNLDRLPIISMFALALVLPVVLPTTFLGETLQYVKSEVKSDTEVATEQRRETIEDSSEPVGREEKREEVTNETSDDQNVSSDSRSSRGGRSRRDNHSDRSDVGDVLGATTADARGVISVHKFVDGAPASTQDTGGYSFAMMAQYGSEPSTNESQQTISYTLNPNNNYEWTTDRVVDTSFSTYEVLHDQDALSRVFTADTCAAACPADLNKDGMIDAFDLSILLDNWAATPGEGSILGDLNSDRVVNGVDLAILLGEWGPCKVAYQLDGYSVAPTYEEAARGITTHTAPTINAADGDQVVIVWNSMCDNSVKVTMCEAGVNLVQNGGFEAVDVENDTWDIFDTNDGLGWVVAWIGGNTDYQGLTRPNPAKLEIQAGVFGWNSSEGKQHAELDTDWEGPNGPIGGEPASVKIYQDIATIPGMQYELRYDFAARPGTGLSDNTIEVTGSDAFSNVITATAEDNPAQPVWNTTINTFTATASTTRITFSDLGTPNSLGTLLDNVKLTCLPVKDTSGGEEDTGDDNGDDTTTDEDGDGTIAGDDSNGGGGGSNGSNKKNSSNGAGNVLGASTAIGDVLGAYTCTDPYLKEYIKYGRNNNAEEVKKLQMFLNKMQGTDIPVTGFYGPQTRDAVNKFQLFHNMFILRPWMQAGFVNNDTTPTGYVYQTTQRWINLLECPVLNMPMPTLVLDKGIA